VRTARSSRRGAVPRDLAALESSDGEIVVLSFALPPERGRKLTPAESEVARHLLAGLSNAEIAAARGSSSRTVANLVARVFRKLGVRSRLELVAFAALFDPGP
jgi:DNA-binding CsgD family transcriptional regulator